MSAMAETFDIAVVGAGTAGVVAALAAARKGARVALVEATDRLGGTAIHGLHRFVCGLFLAGGSWPGAPLHGTATLDFCRRLAGGDPGERAVRRGRVWLLPFAGGAALEACAEAAVGREANIRVYRRNPPVRVVPAAGRIAEIELASGESVNVKAAIDCTGSAALCRMAGCEVVSSSAPALAGYGVEVRGVEEGKASPWGLSISVPLRLRREANAGRLAPHLAFSTWEPGDLPGSGWIKLALPLAQAARAREAAEAVWNVLKPEPAFARADVARFLPDVLPRERGHLAGEYLLTRSDVLAARRFPDGVVRNAWPIERWTEDQGVVYRYLPDGECHDIPVRCLRPNGGPANLLCAGAAISADSEAAAAIRVMGVCMALGEAAAAEGLRCAHGG